MPLSSGARKARKTFSLSPESVSYLESLRKAKKAKSISSILEDLIRQRRELEAMKRFSASVTDYYDSLSDEEVVDNNAWGQFAETQFPTES
jgi:hypothetical protein